jgi:hypothetical protein
MLLPGTVEREEDIRRRGLGLQIDQVFDLGARHRLHATLGVRDFTGSGADGSVLLDHWAAGPGGAAWLAPEEGWWVLSVRDQLTARDDFFLGYGARLEQRDGGSLAWVPGLDVRWAPVSGTAVEAGISYRGGDDAPGTRGERALDPVSARLSLRQQLGSRTWVAVGVAQENLLSRDPFACGGAGVSPVAGIWTDGSARAREVSLAFDSSFGKVEGRLQYHAGQWQGRLAAPDPFEFTAAVLGPGLVRFLGVQAAIVVLSTDTEVGMALDRLGPEEAAEYTTIGLRVSQGLGTPFRAGGEWRLLLDYEGIEGGRPFREAPPMDRVARVSGGVAVRF